MIKNSWKLSIKIDHKYIHEYFCVCGHRCNFSTSLEDGILPDHICPICKNDYFIDTYEWENGTRTKIWKHFYWEKENYENSLTWGVEYYFTIPRYSQALKKTVLEKQTIFGALLNKKAGSKIQFQHKYPILSKYSLFLEDRVQSMKKLLINDAKEYLFESLFKNRPPEILWMNRSHIENLDMDKKYRCIQYFLTHKHLTDIEFFRWNMPLLHAQTKKLPSQSQMLEFIVDHKTQKSVKKALYATYKQAIEITGYYPYSDYVFSRTINDINYLTQLLSVYPAVKQHIFTDENFSIAREFIVFLKTHYSEKQISKLFLVEMQHEHNARKALLDWRDTLRLLQTPNIFKYLEEHFWKVKLKVKSLHDEITRISHIAMLDNEEHSNLVYKEFQYLSEVEVEGLVFKLPKNTVELSKWAKNLRNCMFGYVSSIKKGQSIIYTAFRNHELLYAIEIRGANIVQALGKFNTKIEDHDISIIKKWHNRTYIQNMSHILVLISIDTINRCFATNVNVSTFTYSHVTFNSISYAT